MPAHSPEEIHALIAEAFTAGDPNALAELYEEDAMVIVPPDGRRVTGRDAIRVAVESALESAVRARSDVVEMLEGDGLALTHARWSVVGEGAEMSGRGTIVSRRQPDGTWLIALDNPMSPP
jgi:uncharacterized protein (TIGR02246 family)